MKNFCSFYIIIIVLFAQNLSAQLILDKETGLLKNEKIIKVDAGQKTDLYEKCQEWISLHFAHHEKVITSHNPIKGIIVGQYFEDYKINTATKEFYNFIRFYIKDDVVKVIINNIRDSKSDLKIENFLLNQDGSYSHEKFESTFKEVDRNTSMLISSLENYLCNEN